MTEPAADALQSAVNRLQAAIGAGHVRLDAAEIDARSRDTSLWTRTPAVIVYPGSTEEVVAAVRIAADCGLKVWAFSKGKNWGYGATMAYRDGAVIIVLERMNRILEMNEELAYVVVEPGVTQGQLHRYLQERGGRFWTDCTDSSPEASVIGNALERGVGYTPYSDHFGHLCGLEVVLADGTVVCTGGGGEASLGRHTYKWGTGPYLEGLFSQSNFGIVTQAGVWVMPAPEVSGGFVCEVTEAADQPAVVDAIRRLALHRLLPANVHIVNDILALAQMSQYPYDLTHGEGRLPPDLREQMQQRYKLTPWTVTGGLYGTAAQVRLARRAVRDALSPYGKVTFLDDRKMGWLRGALRVWRWVDPVPGVSGRLRSITGSSLERLEVLPPLYRILKGEPGEDIVGFAYFKSASRPRHDVDPGRDGAGLTWMAVVSPLTGHHTQALLDLCEPLYQEHGLDLSVALILVNERSVLALFEIFYDRRSTSECTRMQALYDELARVTAAAGYQQFRTSVAYSDRVLAGSPALRNVSDSIKHALDPEGVLAPGRYGIDLDR